MKNITQHKDQLDKIGFSIIDDVYSKDDIQNILTEIDSADPTKDTFRKSKDLFAIRQFLKEVPRASGLILTERLKSIVREVIGEDYFVVKSIYFDKPETSNWYVSYHQDLTISVDKRSELPSFGPWTIKQNQFAVQPPLEYLENVCTIRIHLDNTDENNGALKVIPGSHLKQIYRPETIDWTTEKEQICRVPKGGVMLMKPLLLHSSGRTLNNEKRRVIHIELANKELPADLKWAERVNLN